MAEDLNLQIRVSAQIDELKRSMRDFRGELQQLQRSGTQSNRALASSARGLGTLFSPFKRAIDEAADSFGGLQTVATESLLKVGSEISGTVGKFAALRKEFTLLANAREIFADSVRTFTIRSLALGLSTSRAVSFESAFADVRKVVSGTADELQRVEQSIKGLGREIPISLGGLAAIGAQGGRLGIPVQDLEEFIRLSAEVSAAFDILPAEAGNAIGTLGNIFDASLGELRRFADQINTLADNANAAERDILSVLTRAGGAAQRFGLLREETAALSAAMLSLGKPPEIAATALRNLLSSLQDVEGQSDNFQQALATLGFDADAFAKRLRDEPAAALDEFLARLADLERTSQTQALNRLFGRGEDTAAIGDLVASLDEYRRLVRLAGDDSETAGSLIKTFAERSNTAAAQLTLLRNNLDIVSVNLGSVFLPAIRAASELLSSLSAAIADLAERFPNLALLAQQLFLVASFALPLRILTFAFRRLAPVFGPIVGAVRSFTAALSGLFATGAGATGLFGRLALVVTGLGRVLLALVGGPVGVAIAGIATLIVKYTQWREEMVTVGGETAKLSDVVEATWRVITGTISAAADLIGQAIDDMIIGLAELTGVNRQTWRSIVEDTNSGVDQWLLKTKAGVNAAIATFVILGKGAGVIAAAIVQAFSLAFEDVRRLGVALGQDVAAALTGDFSFDSIGAAFGDAIGRQRQNLAQLGGELAAIRDQAVGTDVVGGLVDSVVGAGKAAADGLLAVGRSLSDATARELRAIERERGRAGASGRQQQQQADGGETLAFGDAQAGGRSGRRAGRSDRAARIAARAAEQALREELAIKRQLLTDDLEFERDVLAQREAALQAQLDAGEISYRDYYAELNRLRTDFIDREIETQRELLTLTDSRIEQLRILANIRRLELQRAGVALSIAREQAQAERDLGEQMIAVRLRVAELTGDIATATRIRVTQMRQQYAQLITELLAMGDQAGLALVEKLINLEALKQGIDQQRDALKSAYDQTAGEIENSLQQFLFDPFDADLNKMLLNFIDTLRRMATEAAAAEIAAGLFGEKQQDGARKGGLLQDIGAAFGFGGEQQKQRAGGLLGATRGITEAAPVFVKDVGAAGGLSGLGDILSGSSSEDAIGGGAGGDQLAGKKDAALGSVDTFFGDLFDSVSSGFGSLFGSIGGILSGGFSDLTSTILSLVKSLVSAIGGLGLAEGGEVRGPGSTTSDSIPAMLSNGEFVVKAQAVRSVGTGFLHAINNLQSPPRVVALASGGVVGRAGERSLQQTPAAPAPAQQEKPVAIFNVLDPGLLDEYASTPRFEQKVVNVINRNRGALNG